MIKKTNASARKTHGSPTKPHIYWHRSNGNFAFCEGERLPIDDFLAVDDAVDALNERGQFAKELKRYSQNRELQQ